jgi:hypothetical protein
MNIAEIESQLKELVEQPFDPDGFVPRFLEIYEAPKATVARLRQGAANSSSVDSERRQQGIRHDLLWKKRLFFRVASRGESAATVDVMVGDPLVK